MSSSPDIGTGLDLCDGVRAISVKLHRGGSRTTSDLPSLASILVGAWCGVLLISGSITGCL
jgi:hypothetical protein